MYQIKMINKISASGLSQLDREHFVYGDSIEDPDGILVRSANIHDMEFNPNLRCIARAGAGVNNIPVDKCSESSVVVFNTPGGNANAVAEMVICSLFLASRDIIGGIKWTETLASEGDKIPTLVEKGKGAFVGPEIIGKTLGVIGLGAVGFRAANAAVKLGMNVYGYDPYLSVDTAWKLSKDVRRAQTLQAIYENCDYITLHLPLLDTTKGMINETSITSMRTGVRILNFARGELVDNADIAAALEAGKVSRYITDFPCEATLKMKNTINIPHLGASTPESEENCAVMAVAQLKDYLLTGNIKNSVNFPDVQMDRSGEFRMCMIHRNVPNMLTNILSLLSTEGVNVENMINKSKGDYAYTMLDLNTAVSEELRNKIKAVADILRVRIIK